MTHRSPLAVLALVLAACSASVVRAEAAPSVAAATDAAQFSPEVDALIEANRGVARAALPPSRILREVRGRDRRVIFFSGEPSGAVWFLEREAGDWRLRGELLHWYDEVGPEHVEAARVFVDDAHGSLSGDASTIVALSRLAPNVLRSPATVAALEGSSSRAMLHLHFSDEGADVWYQLVEVQRDEHGVWRRPSPTYPMTQSIWEEMYAPGAAGRGEI